MHCGKRYVIMKSSGIGPHPCISIDLDTKYLEILHAVCTMPLIAWLCFQNIKTYCVTECYTQNTGNLFKILTLNETCYHFDKISYLLCDFWFLFLICPLDFVRLCKITRFTNSYYKHVFVYFLFLLLIFLCVFLIFCGN